MPLRMHNDNVLVEYEAPPGKSKSGLLSLPDMAKRRPVQLYAARVVAVGPGFWGEVKTRPERSEDRGEQKQPRIAKLFVPTGLKVGQRVLIGGMAGDNVRGGPEARQRRIVRESECEAVVGEGVRVNG